MPIYEYQCKNCGHTLDELQSIKEPPLLKCPVCKKDTLQRLIGTGGGLIFKGSGFYLTDYKNKSRTKSTGNKSTSEKTETKTEVKTETKAETKPADKTETKPGKKESKKN